MEMHELIKHITVGDVAQLVWGLPNNHEALNSIPSTSET